MQERRIRAWGPYRHGRNWRVVFGDGEGRRHTEPFGSRTEAEEAIAQVGDRTGCNTVGKAIDGYEVAMRDKGNKSRSIDATTYRLRGFFARLLPRRLRSVTPDDCEKAYAELAHRRRRRHSQLFRRQDVQVWRPGYRRSPCVAEPSAAWRPLLLSQGGALVTRCPHANDWCQAAISRTGTKCYACMLVWQKNNAMSQMSKTDREAFRASAVSAAKTRAALYGAWTVSK